MSEIKVPEGMLKAIYRAKIPCMIRHEEMEKYLESALRWLSENPIAPTKEQMREIVSITPLPQTRQEYSATIFCMEEWQRRMFLAPEDEVPEELSDLLHPAIIGVKRAFLSDEQAHNNAVIEAFRRGQKAGAK